MSENSKVLEVVSGPGYFSIKIVKTISKGKLVLTDIQQEMFDLAKRRIDNKGLKNVEYYLFNENKFNLQDNSFDRIFFCSYWRSGKQRNLF